MGWKSFNKLSTGWPRIVGMGVYHRNVFCRITLICDHVVPEVCKKVGEPPF
jgi:hypothetical protein